VDDTIKKTCICLNLQYFTSIGGSWVGKCKIREISLLDMLYDVLIPHMHVMQNFLIAPTSALCDLSTRRTLLIKPVGIGTAEAIVPVLIKVGAALMYMSSNCSLFIQPCYLAIILNARCHIYIQAAARRAPLCLTQGFC
jgi:hypothetical protein